MCDHLFTTASRLKIASNCLNNFTTHDLFKVNDVQINVLALLKSLWLVFFLTHDFCLLTFVDCVDVNLFLISFFFLFFKRSLKRHLCKTTTYLCL